MLVFVIAKRKRHKPLATYASQPAHTTKGRRTMTLLANKFVQIASKIDATNAQIAALQAKLSELQDYQQQLPDR